MIKTTVDANREMWKDTLYTPENSVTDIVEADKVLERINTCLRSPPFNIGKNDFCYIKVVKNHLEIGRAKIVLDE